MLASTRKEIRGRLLKIHHETIEQRVRYHNAYQPIAVGPVSSRKTTRECADRWEIIKKTIQETSSRNLLDLGCAEGFFVRKAGEMGLFALGLDRDYNRLGLIENCRIIDKSENSAFALCSIDDKQLERMPNFDTVLCLSVMHHIIRQNSVEHGIKVLRAIKEKTNKALIFDIGQTNEVSTTWAKKLPYMGDDPRPWIADFLKQGGFKNPEVVGETDAFQDQVKRYVFRCKV